MLFERHHYRHVGGEKDIREAVLEQSATRIVETVRTSVEGRTGEPAGKLFPVLSLLPLPGPDPRAEREMLQRFVAPAFAEN